MTPQEVGRIVRAYATHHDHGEGWVYTRDLGDLEAIRFTSDHTGFRAPHRRVARFLRELIIRRKRNRLFEPETMKEKFYYFLARVRITFRRPTNLPDGRINGNITFWEEDGEYIECVGPTVGVKVADLLEQDSDNPLVISLAEEIQRIWKLSEAKRKESLDE